MSVTTKAKPQPVPTKELLAFGGSSIIDLIEFRARHQANWIAYTHTKERDSDEQTLSYADLEYRVKELAACLQSYDVKGERLILLYPTGIDYLIAYLATIFAGAISVPVYEPRQSAHFSRLEGIIKDARPKFLLTTENTLKKSNQKSIDLLNCHGARWLCTDTLTAEKDPGIEWQPVKLDPNDTVFIQYTSGSTGDPKGVLVSDGNLIHNSSMISQAIRPHGDFLHVTWLPPYHDMGLIGGLLQPLYSGFPCVMMSPMTVIQRPSRLLRAIDEYSATICGGPNFIYESCVKRVRDTHIEGLDLSSWEVAFNGAEPINAETITRFSERFEPYGFNPKAHFPCYGMAESTLYISGAKAFGGAVMKRYAEDSLRAGKAVPVGDVPSEAAFRELPSSGTIMRDRLTVKVVDPEIFVEKAPRQIGEIWVRGESVCKGYWQRPTEIGEEFLGQLHTNSAENYLRTGDLGFFDGEELFITGRIKDLIIVNGKNHYPQDIEWSIAGAHETIKPSSTAAFSVDSSGHESLAVVQEWNSKLSETARLDMVEKILDVVSSEHQLKVWRILLIQPGTLPKTSSGKIRRQAAKKLFLDKQSISQSLS